MKIILDKLFSFIFQTMVLCRTLNWSLKLSGSGRSRENVIQWLQTGWDHPVCSFEIVFMWISRRTLGQEKGRARRYSLWSVCVCLSHSSSSERASDRSTLLRPSLPSAWLHPCIRLPAPFALFPKLAALWLASSRMLGRVRLPALRPACSFRWQNIPIPPGAPTARPALHLAALCALMLWQFLPRKLWADVVNFVTRWCD